jgi:hypothetical protein
LRFAAQSLHHSKSALGNYYRRMRARLGAAKAITAAAHRLARIIFHLVNTGQEFDESRFQKDRKGTRIAILRCNSGRAMMCPKGGAPLKSGWNLRAIQQERVLCLSQNRFKFFFAVNLSICEKEQVRQAKPGAFSG